MDQYIGRIVAFVLTPILLPVCVIAATWLQNKVGIDLTGTELSAYIIAVATGLIAVILKWLHNRGQWELSNLNLEKYLAEAANVIKESSQIEAVQVNSKEPKKNGSKKV